MKKKALILILAISAFTSCVSFVDTIVPKINITVFNAGTAVADLYAATTRYESNGYTFEKVKLDRQGDWFTGELPVKYGTASVSIIIWEDSIIDPIVYGGSTGFNLAGASGERGYSTGYHYQETRGYFTPCNGATVGGGGTTLFNSLISGRLPSFAFNTPGSLVVSPVNSTEKYILVTGVADSGVSADFVMFAAPALAAFCECGKNVVFVTGAQGLFTPITFQPSDWAHGLLTGVALNFTAHHMQSSLPVSNFSGTAYLKNSVIAQVTDTNASATGGKCLPR